jgi:hypothetical protein
MTCIGCDLDGTLAEYNSGDFKRWKAQGLPATTIGRPIARTVARVQAALARGYEVWIFTSRLSPEWLDITEQAAAIAAWTQEHVGKRLDATAYKLERFDEIWDDKAIRVAKNQGASGFVIGSLWHELEQGLVHTPLASTGIRTPVLVKPIKRPCPECDGGHERDFPCATCNGLGFIWRNP